MAKEESVVNILYRLFDDGVLTPDEFIKILKAIVDNKASQQGTIVIPYQPLWPTYPMVSPELPNTYPRYVTNYDTHGSDNITFEL